MDAETTELVKIIMLDPVLTAKVLNLVNSSFYGLPERITSLAQAVIMLGVNTVKNIAISTILFSSMSFGSRWPAVNPDGFWQHCLATAVGCKLMAAKLNIPSHDRESFFIAGLLHDIGKILLMRTNTEKYRKAVLESKRFEVSLEFSEYVHFGCSHAQAGGLLARKWHLGRFLISAIEQHHSFSPSHPMPISEIVSISNNLCKRERIGDSGNCIIEEIAEDFQNKYRIDANTLSIFSDVLPSEIEKSASLLNMAQDNTEK